MAKRYGGKYSPTTGQSTQSDSGSYARARVNPVGARANVLFVPAIVLVATTFWGGPISLTLGLIGAGILTLAAYLLRGGLEAEAAYNERKVARRPAFPRKMAASVLTGLGIATATAAHDGGLIAIVLYGLAAAALHFTAFGPDPMKHKGMEGIDTFQQDRVARVVDEAEKHLNAMKDAVLRARDRQMESKVDAFQDVARDLIRTVEEDPRDLNAARKYLGVYLLGARDATSKFADIYSRTQDQKAREDYAQFLDEMTDNFAQRTRKLLIEDRTDLTIEIDVLRDRLAREGVRIDPES